MTHRRAVLLVVVGLCGAASVVTAQEKAIQIGTKTSSGGYAVTTEVVVAVDDGAKATAAFGKAIENLTNMATAEGFTLLGPARIAMKSMGPGADGKLPTALELPIIDQPSDEDLKAQYGFGIVKLEEQKVAYTYHKGALDQLQMTMFGLLTWIGQQQLQIAGMPSITIYPDAKAAEPQVAEVQVPVK